MVLIRPERVKVSLPRLAMKSGWYNFCCTCCGAIRRKWMERGDTLLTSVGYCPKSHQVEVMYFVC